MQSTILDNSFVNQYIHKPSPFDKYGLGEFVYKRSYARYKQDNTQEEWYETIQRVINGIFKIKQEYYSKNNIKWNVINEKEQAQTMYDLMFNAKFLPGGRGLWAMGTAITDDKKLYAALNNCAAITTKNIETELTKPFEFLFDMCMLGTGVGFDTMGADKITIHKPNDTHITYVIEDSREGWVNALRELLNQYFKENYNTIDFDYSKIRPAGQKLKTFGGTSSGYEPLKKSFDMINELLKNNINKKLSSKLIVDIMNMICLCVISGNVRRSASIAVGKSSDEEFMNLKDYNIYPERYEYGWLSNNSVICNVGDDYSIIAEHIKNGSGEPGVMWLDNMRKYSRMDDKTYADTNVMLTNPCGEISLESYELCNLVEIFINRQTSYKDFITTLQYAYLYAKIVSLCTYHWKETTEVVAKNRRLGISLTGIANFIEDKGIHTLKKWTTNGYRYLKQLDTDISNTLKINKSIKLTCIKPSGTISLMIPNTCSGIHYPTSRFYIRRVRINNESKDLIQQMKNNGYIIEDSVTEPNTKIIDFIVDNRCNRTIDDLSIWEQVEMAACMQKWWADNQVSCTISFTQQEADDIKNVLKFYQYRLKSATFLPKFENLNKLPQLPYEKISEQQYHELIKQIKYNKLMIDQNNQELENYCTSESCDLKAYNKYLQKHIIFMRGVVGSGKSFIAKKINDYLNTNGLKSKVISKDDFRCSIDGYIYNKDYEKIVNDKYIDSIKSNIKTHKYLILDNTHINEEKIDDIINIIKNITTNIKFVIIDIPPYKDVKIHVENNNHNITIENITNQLNNLNKFINNHNYTILNVERIENNKISMDEINNIIKKIQNYFA